MNVTSGASIIDTPNHPFIQNIQSASPDQIRVLAHGIAKCCQEKGELPQINLLNPIDNLKLISDIAQRYLQENQDEIDETFSIIYRHSFDYADKQPKGELRQKAERICKERFVVASPIGWDRLPKEIMHICLSYLVTSYDTPWNVEQKYWEHALLTSCASFRETSQKFQEIFEEFLPVLVNKGYSTLLPGISTFETLKLFLMKQGSQIQNLNLSEWNLSIEEINCLIEYCPHLIELSIPILKTDIPQSESTITPLNFNNILKHKKLETLKFYHNSLQKGCPYFFDHCLIGLSELKNLYFNCVKIKDLYYSQSMAHIEKIVVDEVDLENFGSLIFNPQLKHLDLLYTQVKDIKQLSSFKLQALHLTGTSVVDYTPLEEHLHLESFHFGYPLRDEEDEDEHQLIDISPIQNLKQLKELSLSRYADNLSSLKGLCQLEKLDELYCVDESELSVLTELKHLKDLKIEIFSQKIDDLSFLSHLVEMENLFLWIHPTTDSDSDSDSDLDSQHFLDVSALFHLTQLKKLSLRAPNLNKQKVLNAISGLIHLEYLNLDDTIYQTKESIEELKRASFPSGLGDSEGDKRKQANKRSFSECQDQDEEQQPNAKKMCFENTH